MEDYDSVLAGELCDVAVTRANVGPPPPYLIRNGIEYDCINGVVVRRDSMDKQTNVEVSGDTSIVDQSISEG